MSQLEEKLEEILGKERGWWEADEVWGVRRAGIDAVMTEARRR